MSKVVVGPDIVGNTGAGSCASEVGPSALLLAGVRVGFGRTAAAAATPLAFCSACESKASAAEEEEEVPLAIPPAELLSLRLEDCKTAGAAAR